MNLISYCRDVEKLNLLWSRDRKSWVFEKRSPDCQYMLELCKARYFLLKIKKLLLRCFIKKSRSYFYIWLRILLIE